MKKVSIFLGLVMLAYAGLSIYAAAMMGFRGFYEAVTQSAATILMTVNIMLLLGVSVYWMVKDARKHNVSASPYVLLALAAGPVGPLLYLARQSWQ